MIKHKFLTLFVALICAVQLFAYDAYVDGIYYNLNTTDKTATVTNRTGSYDAQSYSGVVAIPPTITYDSQTYSVTTIGDEAFYNCRGLTSITIPNSVTTIGEDAFAGCTSLPVINNLRYADTYLVEAVDKTLSTYTIKEDTKWIGDEAFEDCDGLTSLVIPSSVTTIGNSAFGYCSGLTSVTTPNSVTTIGDNAFSGCNGLTSVTIPSSVTTIGGSAFSGVLNIIYNGTATGSPWGAKYVNGYVDGYLIYSDATKTKLCGCSYVVTGEITIPSSVTTIGNYAFSGCSGLTSITIPNSVTTIGYGAFSGCSRLLKTNYTGTIADWCKMKFGGSSANPMSRSANPMSYSHNLFINDVEVKDLVIPEGVDTIANYAFEYCSGLTSVTIPNSVTTIGTLAFEYCSGLTSVTIGNSVTTIGEGAFAECTNLTSVTIPNSVTTIGDYAFSGSGLTSVTIPNSVTTIGGWAFYSCSGLTSVTIPNSVTTIRGEAFGGCSSLTSVTIPNSVETIGGRAFYNVNNIVYSGTATGSPWGAKCVNGYIDGYLVYSDATKTKLCGCSSAATGEITIPNSVTTIGDYAFADCDGLTSITIPNSVTTIGSSAFRYCIALTSITSEATTPPTCGDICFYYVNKSIPLYVPAESVEAYRKAEGWQDFTNILPITAEEVEVTEPETEPTNNSVVISWPSVADGETYTIEIRKGEELICTLVFNANGQLMSINFAAPARGGEHSSRYATATATGWTYTITGLEVGTEYTYTIVAKDNSDKTLYSETGSFKTTEIITSVENVDSQKSQIEGQKVIRNGVLYIERNGKTYNALGGIMN